MAEEPASPTFLLQYYKQYQESTQIQENITSREPTKIFDESRLFNLNELCLVSSHVFQQWLEAKKEEDLGENEFLNVEDLFPESLFINAEWLVNDLSEIMAQFIELFQDKSNNCTKKGICLSVAYWIKKFPAHFDACPQMFKLVSRLKELAVEDGLNDRLLVSLDTDSIPSYDWIRSVSLKNPISKQISLAFHECEAQQLALAICHIDYKSLSRVTTNDLKKYIKSGRIEDSSALQKSIALFNNISNWIQWMILSKTTAKQRSITITQVVDIGKCLLTSRNYNSLMAVIGGVSHSNINRLQKTQNLLPTETKTELARLTNLLSMQNNFVEYRKHMKKENECVSPIPIMGVHMKDLIQLNVVGGFDFVKTGEINLRKFFQLAEVLSHFLGVKKNRHNLGDANHDLINTLKMSFDMSFNEEDLYSLSLKKEPKNLFSFNNNSKTIVFADWASGIDSTPDKEDIQRHTAAMVEAVFKHYDHDKDNSISAEEFQVIVGNFPFIDPFKSIDNDGNGRISRTELFNYFMDFNQKSLKLRSGFKHNFHETTFLTPTMCGHCSKLLWGLIRQGYKCKDCGQSVHSHCKDYVVVECRRFPNITPKKTSSTSSSSDIPVDAAEDPKPVYEEIYGTSEKQKKIGRFNYYNKWKSRTVSTVSEAGSLSPEPFSNKASTDDEQNENVNHNRGTSQQKRIQTRMRSETVDYYQTKSLDYDASVGVATLALEEVFDSD